MSRLFVAAVAVLISVPDGVAAINWETNLERGSAAAVKANKPLLIEFWAHWCPPCLVMDAEVYTNASVIEAMTRVLPVRIDVDKQPQIARRYELGGMPMLVVADSYGNELFRFTGTLTVPTMLQLMNELPGDVTNINRLSRVVAKDKDNFTALAALGEELRAARFWRSSNAYFNRAIRLRARPDQADARSHLLIAMGHNHLELKEFGDAAKLFERSLREFAGGPAEAEAMLGVARALFYQGKRAEAKRALENLIGKYRSGPVYDEAARLLATL